MTTLETLRANLTSKGYAQTSSTAAQQLIAPLITVHTHPLLASPVVLIGANNENAISYQETVVTNAVTRK